MSDFTAGYPVALALKFASPQVWSHRYLDNFEFREFSRFKVLKSKSNIGPGQYYQIWITSSLGGLVDSKSLSPSLISDPGNTITDSKIRLQFVMSKTTMKKNKFHVSGNYRTRENC